MLLINICSFLATFYASPILCDTAMMAAQDNLKMASKSPQIPLCCGGTSVTTLFRTGEVKIIGA